MPHRRLSVFDPKKFSAAVSKALKKNTGPKSVKAAKALLGQLQASTSGAAAGKQVKCDVCQQMGAASEVVLCDECRKNYHFRCLEPPLKKTPKKRGYSWHCADCDPTVSRRQVGNSVQTI